MVNKKTNYCTLSPDNIFGIYIGDACRIHDEFYQSDPKIFNRKDVDKIFLGYLLIELNKWYNIWIAYLYYFIVRIFCKPSWKRWEYKWYFGIIPIKRKDA